MGEAVQATVSNSSATNTGVDLDLSWMKQRGEWGQRARPGRNGLTLADIQINSYGDVPMTSTNLTGRPRGAAERSAGFRIGGYQLRSKEDIWLDNAAWLYEEALQRQWSSATDVPWATLKPLPDDIEQAQCQLATFLTEVEFVAGDVPSRWVARTSPDYFEPRLLLMAQVNDEARHMDVFRKRALANGGGLMERTAGAGGIVGGIDLARDFNEMSARLHLSGEGAVLTLFRMGELMAYNPAEKAIGHFYRVDAELKIERLPLPPVAVANSIAFSPDGSRLYFTDSPTRSIHCVDYHADGRIGTPRLFVQLGVNEGFPDGAAVDADAGLWSAQWDGSCVVRYNSAGVETARVALPVSRPTCPAFGGAALDRLFVSTARVGLSDEALRDQPTAGGVFAAAPGHRGLPEHRFVTRLRA